MRDHILFYLNGERQAVGAAQAGMMLSDYLRYQRGLTGTKVVCAEGDCGACTVLRAFPRPGKKGGASFLPVNACILPLAQLDGASLVTVEALAKDGKLTPVQSAMVQCHGSQCGFCTPGFVMALTGLVEEKIAKGESGIDGREARNALTGNLCRCTGYQQILEAAESVKVKECDSVATRFLPAAVVKELKLAQGEGLHLRSEAYELFAPTSLKEAARYLARHRGVRLLAAATDLGVSHNKRKLRLERILSLHLIPELYRLKASRGEVSVGARVTLAELRLGLKEIAPEFARFLNLFASPQIKNVATLVGNVANASPIADTPPFLLLCDAEVEILGPKGPRIVAIADFYRGYRETALRAGELITGIRFALPGPSEKWALFKASERKDLDISSVNAGFRLRWHARRVGEVAEARVALGGVAATPLRLRRTEDALRGRSLDHATFAAALSALQEEISPIGDVRGSAAFRRVLAENFFRRFWREAGGSAP